MCIITFLLFFKIYKNSNQNDKLKIYFKLTHNIDIYLFSYKAMILNSIMVSMFHHFGDLFQSIFFTFFSSNIRLYYILCIRYRVFAPLIWTVAHAFITHPVLLPFTSSFITPDITPIRNTFILFIRMTSDLILFSVHIWSRNYDVMI